MERRHRMMDPHFIEEDRLEAGTLRAEDGRGSWPRWSAAAAGFCLAVLCTAAIALLPDHSGNDPSNPVL